MSQPRRALLSVSDKNGLIPFATRLVALGFELVSTGGTMRSLRDAGLPVTYVADITGQAEVFDGRVKTLHPAVHGGILFRRDLPSHVAQAREHRIAPIDLVVVNLYPFQATVARPDATWDDAIENIDIGGPAMVRAAAKNHAHVLIVVSPTDYDRVASALEANAVDPSLRRDLALAAFQHTAGYDAAIAAWMSRTLERPALDEVRIEPLVRSHVLRYGENPHQHAALFHPAGTPPLAGAQVLQGKELSYNNLLDLDAAVAAVREFDEPAAVVVKHTNPCGVGRDATSLRAAWDAALAADPVSAFGGIVALNRPVDHDVATELARLFLEVIAAPAFSDDALTVLAEKKNLRLVVLPADPPPTALSLRSTAFGTLIQTEDPRIAQLDDAAWRVVTERAPTDAEATALRFLERVCKHVKSNAIVLGFADRTAGVGAGQMSRVDSVELAVRKARVSLEGASLASDAFFPFRDGVDAAAAAGVRSIVQPGGSRRDDEVIAACNEHGIAMIFTGYRHFRH